MFPKHLRTDYPAKFAPGLIKRIYEHCIAQGYVYPGQLVLDCFAGVSGGGIFAPMFDLHWVGIELEEKFVSLSKANFKLHECKWKKLGKPIPQVLRGDSRRLSAVLSGADLILTSPPFCDVEPYQDKAFRLNDGRRALPQGQDGYGPTEGQLGAMRAGDVSLVCTSPPYAESLQQGKNGIDLSKSTFGPHSQLKTSQQYSSNPSNLGNLPAGKVENVVSGIITSPPWEIQGVFHDENIDETAKIIPSRKNAGKTVKNYGHSLGQIGQESGNTYWEACSEIYKQCFQILEPGGVIVLVLKSYVKGGRRVPLPMQTLKLLIHLGFEPLERIKAMLVKNVPQATMFGIPEKQVQRKSFFRRLHEKRYPHLSINWEEILIVKKPLDTHNGS